MTSFWFATAPPPSIDNASLGCQCRATVVDGEVVWAIVQQPVEPQQLRRQVEWEVMPESLLRDLELQINPDRAAPAALLQNVDLDLPFNAQGFVLDGQPGHMTVGGRLLLTFRVPLGRVDAEVAVADDRWLLAVHPGDQAADLVSWPANG